MSNDLITDNSKVPGSGIGAIFDMDGTLLDSMGVWNQVDIDFFAKRGIPMPKDYGTTVIAMPFERIASYTVERFNLADSPEEIMAEWNDMARYAYTHTVEAKPGAVEYLRQLYDHNVSLAVATSLPPELRDPALEHAGILNYFTALSSTSEVSRGKEHADIYLLAASKLGVKPSQAVVFEDILSGITAAKSAGMQAWGVYDDSSHGDWAHIGQVADGTITDFAQAPRLWESESWQSKEV